MKMLSGEFEKNKKYFSVLLGNNGDPTFQRKIKDKVKPKIKELLISKGVTNENKMDILLEYQISAMLGIMVYMHTSETNPDSREVFEVVSDLNRYGMREAISNLAKENQ